MRVARTSKPRQGSILKTRLFTRRCVAKAASIKRAIKPGGLFVIVDNGPVEDNKLPYHGPYLAKELAISQLERYGFKFEKYEQIIPQRYMLTFRLVAP